jgi:AcrR family transcriptional regulator
LKVAAAARHRRPRGETRRAEVLDAATAVFLEHGYAGATIELVVARAGASKTTIYSFFGDKKGLFTALIEERAERILAGVADIEIGNVDVRTGLTRIAQQYLDVVMRPEAIGLYRLILAEGPRFPDLVNSYYRVGQNRVTARVAEALRIWAERGRVSAEDPDRIAIQFLDTIRGELHLRAIAGLPPPDLRKAIKSNIHHAVRTFWRALHPRGRHET